jgi:hypothetical protein
MDDKPILRVECGAGHRAESAPGACTSASGGPSPRPAIGGAPRHRSFQRRHDGATDLRRQDASEERWAMTLCDSGRRAAARLSCT